MGVNSLKIIGTNPDASQYTFEDFWQTYPRRVAKKDAQKAWAKIDPAKHPFIFAALPQHKIEWRKDAGRYIPHPASWLNGERWLDELESDLSMGICQWNINANRGPEPRCSEKAVMEKHGNVYCKLHGERN